MNFTFKDRLRVPKAKWRTFSKDQLMRHVSRMKYLESGAEAIYIGPFLDGVKHPWPILDVESEDKHDDIQANISAARDFLLWLDAKSLLDGLSILLTGSGFRFVWPWIISSGYKKAFMAFVNDGALPIDPNPQKTRVPIRVLAYRGHPNQGKKTKDVHVHLLSDFNTLWFMTPEEYLNLVKGKLPRKTYAEWLKKILPTRPMPEAWFKMLDEYGRLLKLEKLFFAPRISRPNAGAQAGVWRQVQHYLELEPERIREKQIGDSCIYLLPACPICQRKDGNPFVTSSGRLKCFHRSCQAGDVDEKGRLIGLPARSWVDGFIEPEGFRDIDENQEKKDIHQVREDMTNAIMQSKVDILNTPSPGVGKTTTTLQAIVPQCRLETMLFATPSKKLNDEVAKAAFGVAKYYTPPTRITVFQGRNKGNCTQYDLVERVGKLGYSPRVVLCLSKCSIEDLWDCRYWQQFDALLFPGLCITTHAQIKALNLEGVDTVIIDENPVNTFIQTITSRLDSILFFRAGIGPECQGLFDRIAKVCNEVLERHASNPGEYGSHGRLYATEIPKGSYWEGKPDLWELTGITADDKMNLCRVLSPYEQWPEENYRGWQCRLLRANINQNALNWIWAALGEHPGTAYILINGKNGSVPFQFCHTDRFLPKHEGRYILLDGTGSKPEMDSLFKRDFQVVPGHISLDSCRRVWLKQGLGKVKLAGGRGRPVFSDSQISDLIKKAAFYLRPYDRKILICTFMKIEERVVEIAKRVLPGKVIGSTHYFGARGVNEFENYDAFIGLGTPTVNITGVMDTGVLLFPEEVDREAWFRDQGKNDLIQMVHRVRPVNGKKTIIIMGKTWPAELGRPEIYTDLRRGSQDQIEESCERIKSFLENFGFITRVFGFFLGIGSKRDKDVLEISHDNFVRFVVSCRKKSAKKGEFCLIYNILIRQNSPFLYDFEKSELIVHGNNSYWSTLLELIRGDFPNLPEFEVKDHSGNWSRGIGRLEDVQKFIEALGKEFDPSMWREKVKTLEDDPDDPDVPEWSKASWKEHLNERK